MQLTEVQKVKVGSKITVGGETYTVQENWTSDLVLTNRFGEKRYLHKLIENLAKPYGGNKHLVAVTEEPAPKKANLTDELRKQVTTNELKAQLGGSPKPSLTDALRNQVANQQVVTPKIESASITAENIRSGVITGQPVVGSTPVGSTDLKVNTLNAKVDEVRGNLAQTALRANEANVKADAANQAVSDLAFQTNKGFFDVEEAFEVVTAQTNEAFESVSEDIQDLQERIASLEDAETKRNLQDRLNQAIASQSTKAQSAQNQGGNKMKNVLSSFKNLFGKVEGQFALSLFGGIAIRKSPFSEEWITYKEGDGITDVQGNVLKFDVPAFRLPVEPKAVKKGSIVVAANGNYGYVTEKADGFLKVIFPATASQGTVMPIKNPILGKAFYTQVQVIDFAGGQTGGFDPMLLMALSGEGNKESLLPLLLASGGLTGGAAAGAGFNPMMLLAMGGEGGDGIDDILPLLLLQQGGFAKEGVNPLLFLAMGDKTGKGKDLLPLLLMSGGLGGAEGAGGIQAMLPFLLMGDGGGDIKEILMIQAMSGGAGLFGAPAVAEKKEADKDAE